jgi:hypothetical protein
MTDDTLRRDLDDGFSAQAVTPDLARRQWQVSVGVLGLIAAAMVAVLATIGLPNRADRGPALVSLTIQQPEFVRPVAAAVPQHQSGG